MTPLEKAYISYNPKRPTAYISKIKRNINGEMDELKEKTSFLDVFYENPPITQRLKHYLHNSNEAYKCPVCGDPLQYREKPNPSYNKSCGKDVCHKRQNYLSTQVAIKEKYGVENISQTEEWKNKVKVTNLERRGVEWNTQSEVLIEKRKASWKKHGKAQTDKAKLTNLERYGVPYPTQNNDVKEKMKSTMQNSHAFQVERIQKTKATQVENHGSWFMQTSEFQRKSKETLVSKYGATHNSQVSEVLDKRWVSSTGKLYVFPSGKEAYIQGYEYKCLNELLDNGYKEENIIVGNKNIEEYIGKIIYTGNDSKKHRYFPDIYIVDENTVIEVKSDYTLAQDAEQQNKRKAVENLGFFYKLKVY